LVAAEAEEARARSPRTATEQQSKAEWCRLITTDSC
jgi:hypothetical protein